MEEQNNIIDESSKGNAKVKRPKFYKKGKTFIDKLLHHNSHNMKLWVMLALIPIAITVGVLFYGNNYFDSSIILENDVDFDAASVVEDYDIVEEKNDFKEQINQKMLLPEPKAEPVKTTTKEDKRMLDESGNMVTVEVAEGETLESIAERDAGNKWFWVYYFDVNRDKLNTPEDLKEGMKLYVPNAEYFGFSATDAGSVQYAKKRAAEILQGNEKH